MPRRQRKVKKSSVLGRSPGLAAEDSPQEEELLELPVSGAGLTLARTSFSGDTCWYSKSQ